MDLAPWCREMQIVDIDALVTVLRGHILERTQCNASAGIGKMRIVRRFDILHPECSNKFIDCSIGIDIASAIEP